MTSASLAAQASAHHDQDDFSTLEGFRGQMLTFARMQLNDSQLAEDAVQEAMLGAMKNAKSFGGKSAYKTWVFAILKNKIVDIMRKRRRQIEATTLFTDIEENESYAALFDGSGGWNADDRPSDWGSPEETFSQDQFWEIFEVCLNNLPGKQGKVFMMREYLGMDTEEICEEHSLSVSNLHVILYRARMRLQKCLELKWFGEVAHA